MDRAVNELLSNLPSAFHTTTSLRDFIRRIRAAKTAAEERDVITKESAHIRNAFKSGDNSGIHKNMPKLLYIQMLGYSTHFSQMECISLISSPKFPEKRLGYLALMLLLDERQDLLLLATNTLKNDINSSNQFVAGLALAAVGNLSSEEMARDLAPDVMRLLSSLNQNIKKRAAATLTRLAPELLEGNEADYFYKILNDGNDSVLLTGCEMIHAILETCPSYLPRYREKCTKKLGKLLRDLMRAEFSLFYDVQGIKDPFLHVAILRLMRKLGEGDEATSVQLADILNDYCNFIQGTNSTQEAILYECVLTIFAIPCGNTCREVGMTVIGRFLTHTSNNARFVALSMLKRIVRDNPTAATAYESIILQCLYDPDQSIKRLAFDISLCITTSSNVKTIIAELLIYLSSADDRECGDVCDRIMGTLIEFGNDAEFKLESLITMMQLKGAFVSDGITRQAIATIINNPSIQRQAVHNVYQALKDDISQSALTSLGLWCMGEYGRLLCDASGVTLPGATAHSFDDIFTILDHILQSPTTKPSQTSQLLTSCMKILVADPPSRARVQAILSRFRSHANAELQQRADEYRLLLEDGRPSLLSVLFSGLSDEFRVAAAESASGSSDSSSGSGDESDLLNDILGQSSAPKAAKPRVAQPQPPLPSSTSEVDAMDSFFAGGANAKVSPPASSSSLPSAAPAPKTDLLDDLLSGCGPSPPPPSLPPFASVPSSAPASAPSASAPAPFDLFGSLPLPAASTTAPAASAPSMPDLMGLFPSPGAASAMPASAPPPPGLEVFRNADVVVRFSMDTDLSNTTTVTAEVQNRRAVPLRSVLLQVAVPKFLSVKMDVPSGTELQAQASLYQRFVLTTSAPEKKKAVKARISYSCESRPMDAQFTFNQFL